MGRVSSGVALVVIFACSGGGGGSDVRSDLPAPLPPPPPAPQVSPDSLVTFDGGHLSNHSVSGTYASFARIVTADGWTVRTTSGRFRSDSLKAGRVLVIANALAPQNYPSNWRLPTPSAFSADEIIAVRRWVEDGGGLLLIADHMPFAGAASDLAAEFGAVFSNGFAFDPRQLVVPNSCLRFGEVHLFKRADGSLANHTVTTGVNVVGTFTGSAFQWDAMPLLVFNDSSVSLEPQVAWQFPVGTRRISVAGWSQGAVKRVGRGRVAIFGEAAMFSEQNCSPTSPMGFNHPEAEGNQQLVLRVVRWLGGRLD